MNHRANMCNRRAKRADRRQHRVQVAWLLGDHARRQALYMASSFGDVQHCVHSFIIRRATVETPVQYDDLCREFPELKIEQG